MIRIQDELILQAVWVREERGIIPFIIFRAVTGRILDDTQALVRQRPQHLAVKPIHILPVPAQKAM